MMHPVLLDVRSDTDDSRAVVKGLSLLQQGLRLVVTTFRTGSDLARLYLVGAVGGLFLVFPSLSTALIEIGKFAKDAAVYLWSMDKSTLALMVVALAVVVLILDQGLLSAAEDDGRHTACAQSTASAPDAGTDNRTVESDQGDRCSDGIDEGAQ